MTKGAGRDVVISKGGTPIAGILQADVDWSGEFMKVTDKDSAGIETYLAGKVKSQEVKVKISGWSDSTVLQDIALDPAVSKFIADLTIVLPVASSASKDTLGGTFKVSNFKLGHPYDEGVTFECEFSSSGLWTYS